MTEEEPKNLIMSIRNIQVVGEGKGPIWMTPGDAMQFLEHVMGAINNPYLEVVVECALKRV